MLVSKRLIGFVQVATASAVALVSAQTKIDPNFQTANPVVRTPQGDVQGFISGNLTQFLGIPFAAPP